MHEYSVYIMADKKNGTLYIGFTNNLYRRVYEHKTGQGSKFTAKHKTKKLVYFESSNDPSFGIYREKFLKGKRREYKIRLIELTNPHWLDISNGWYKRKKEGVVFCG
jgi:putative endonuclease